MKKIFLSILFLIAWASHSQVYPVQVNAQLIPPYSMKLTDYEQMTDEKLFVNLLLTDINEVNRQVRLKMYIDGPGIHIQNVDVVQGVQPIFLDGGVSLQLTNLDLRPYFRFDNLQGISIQQYNSFLPDGAYHFCFEVYDYVSNQLLSQKGCAHAFLLLNDPPFLNIPFDNDIVTAQNPQNIVFTWTPRHVNAINVTYDYTLKELIDPENTDIVVAFAGGIPMLQETLHATSLVYGPAETPLMEGKTYAWQVRAYVTDGFTETALFRNNGYSEIYKFIYTANCPAPTNIMSDAIDATTEHIVWTGAPEHLQYNIQYRKIGANDWFEQDAYNEEVTLHNLEAEQVYEFRVGGQCMAGSGFAYSSIYQFTMPDESSQASYNCGLPPPNINTTNQNPLPQLKVNQTFTAGDFSVKVTEVSGSNGVFTGKGMIVFNLIKGLAGITDTSPINIAVKFEDIHINTDFQLTDGFVKTTYDPTWGDIVDSNAITDNLFGETGNINSYDASNIDIDDIQVDTTATVGNVTLIDNTGTSHSITTGLPVVIHGDNNETWVIDEDGHVTQVETAQGGQATAQNTNGVTNSGNVTQITSTDVSVVFNPGGYYSSDPIRLNTSQDFKDQYDKIPQTAGGDYYPLYKLIARQPDSIDYVTAQVSLSNGKTKDDIVFKTRQGLRMDTVIWNGNTATLKFKNRFRFAKEKILACVKPADTTQNYDIAGTMNLWHTRKGDTLINVKLVPVGNAQISANTIAGITEIYQKAGIRLNITQDSPFDITQSEWDIENPNGVLDIGDSGLLANYTPEERAIYNKYKQERTVVKKMYYMFVLDSSIPVSDTGVTGFMPLKRQFGFAFNPAPGAQARTIAHELGHGIFGLKHPFDEYNFAQGSTDLLMDYGNGTEFSHMDWQKMHAPGIQIYWFQGDEQGEHTVLSGIPERFWNSDHQTVTFLTVNGSYITLPKRVKKLRFTTGLDNLYKYMKYPTGALLGFTIDGINYFIDTEHNAITNNLTSDDFSFIYKGFASDSGLYLESNQNDFFNSYVIYLPHYGYKKLYKKTLTNISFSQPPISGQTENVNILNNYANYQIFYTADTSEETPGYSYQDTNLYDPSCFLKEEYINSFFGNNINWGDKYLIVSKLAMLNNSYHEFIENSFNTVFGQNYSVDTAYLAFQNLTNQELINNYVQLVNEIRSEIGNCQATIHDEQSSVNAIQKCVKAFTDDEIKDISVQDKINIISHYLQNIAVFNAEEIQLVRLIKFTKQSDIDPLIDALSGKSTIDSNKYLLESLTYHIDNEHVWIGNDNYLEFFRSLGELALKSNNFNNQVINYSDDELLDRTINFYYRSLFDKLGSLTRLSYINCQESTSADFIEQNDSLKVEITNSVSCNLLFPSIYTQPKILDPFEPIWFTNKSTLSMLSDYNKDVPVLSPAVLVYYAADTGNTKTIEDAVNTTVDLVTLATGYGGLVKSGTYIRKAFIVADMLGAGVSIVTTATYDNLSQEGKDVLDALNTLTAVIAVGDMAYSGISKINDIYRKVKNNSLPLPSFNQFHHFVNKINVPTLPVEELSKLPRNKLEESLIWLDNFEVETTINDATRVQNLKVEVKNAKVRILNAINLLETRRGRILNELRNFVNTNLNNLNTVEKQKLIHNFENANIQLLDLFDQANQNRKIQLAEACNKIISSIPINNGTTRFARDPLVVKKVANMMQDGSVFRIKVSEMGKNWETTLEDVLKAGSVNPCGVCGEVFMQGTFSLDKYLDDMEYYLTHFTNKTGANKLNHWVLGRNVNGDVVSNSNWLEINQTIDYLKRHQIHTKTDIEFGKHFQTGNTSKSCDIYYKEGTIEKFIELKNVDFSNINDLSILNTGTTSMQRIEQVIGQKGAFSRINNLNEYEWVATALKNDDINHLKQLWKKAFLVHKDEAFNVIWANQNLRTSLFGGRTESVARTYFNSLINSESSILYDFIKVE